jgi:FKBP-type peptidyl-prolyl cis-trans isomerase
MVNRIIYLALLVIFSWSCTKSIDDERLEKEDAAIEKYLKSRNLKFNKQNGVYHAIRSKGYGYRVAHGDSISFWYIGYTFGTGGLIFDTNILEVALEIPFDTSVISLSPVVTVAGDNELIEGVRRGLLICREKELATILFSSIYGFGDQKVGPIPSWSPLAYDILLISVNNYQIRVEQENISTFVNQNEGFVLDTLGFWKKFLNESYTDLKPSLGDTIYGWYRASVLNGEVFAETPEEGQQIIIGDDELTEGLTFGYMLMSPNQNAELVVPSSMAYGVNGYGTVPPYTPLLYEIRLDSIK